MKIFLDVSLSFSFVGLINVRKAVFVIRRLILVMFEVFVVVKRGKVCLVPRGKGCNVCAFTFPLRVW